MANEPDLTSLRFLSISIVAQVTDETQVSTLNPPLENEHGELVMLDRSLELLIGSALVEHMKTLDTSSFGFRVISYFTAADAAPAQEGEADQR